MITHNSPRVLSKHIPGTWTTTSARLSWTVFFRPILVWPSAWCLDCQTQKYKSFFQQRLFSKQNTKKYVVLCLCFLWKADNKAHGINRDPTLKIADFYRRSNLKVRICYLTGHSWWAKKFCQRSSQCRFQETSRSSHTYGHLAQDRTGETQEERNERMGHQKYKVLAKIDKY